MWTGRFGKLLRKNSTGKGTFVHVKTKEKNREMGKINVKMTYSEMKYGFSGSFQNTYKLNGKCCDDLMVNSEKSPPASSSVYHSSPESSYSFEGWNDRGGFQPPSSPQPSLPRPPPCWCLYIGTHLQHTGAMARYPGPTRSHHRGL